MSKYTDHLWQDLVRDHGATLAHTDRPEPVRARALRRPRILAGSTLGLAGVGAGIVLALGGTAATSPAYALSVQHGAVSVHVYRASGIASANRKLAAMGITARVAKVGVTPNLSCLASGPAPAGGQTLTVTMHPSPTATGDSGAGATGPISSGTPNGIVGPVIGSTWHAVSCALVRRGTTIVSGTTTTSISTSNNTGGGGGAGNSGS